MQAPVSISANACEAVLTTAINGLFARGMLQENNGLFRADTASIEILSYYANSIAHWRREPCPGAE